jgi:hypothetical protein
MIKASDLDQRCAKRVLSDMPERRMTEIVR